MEVEKMFNVIRLKAELLLRPFKWVYVYADSLDRKSLPLIERKRIRGFRARAAFLFEKYCLICCELNKGEEKAFLEALDELHRNLLIMGYRDYEAFCDEAFTLIKQGV